MGIRGAFPRFSPKVRNGILLPVMFFSLTSGFTWRWNSVFITSEIEGWNVAGLSPTLLSCSIHDDLLDASSWRRSDPFVFRDKVHFPEGVGIPFTSH